MKYEFYKLFVKRKAWLLILIFMGLRLITVFLQPNYVRDYKMEMYRDSYMEHMEVLEGKLTDEKKAYISEQNSKIQKLLNQDTSVEAYINGDISEEEFNERYRQRNTGYQQQTEFEVINERYQSILTNPERVYFIYSNGWTALIGNENLDFVLLILLMLLIVPMICNEFSTDMYPVLRTTPNGGMRLFASKFAVGMITAVLCAILFFAEECIYFAAVFGLPNGAFPLQSLAPFENSPYQISIFGATLLTLANRCFGAMFMTALVLCLSAMLRRALSAIFLGTISVLLPFVLFSQSTMKYLFPTPLGFLLSSGLLRGTYAVTPFSSQIVTLTPKQYLTTSVVSSGIILLLFLIGMCAFAGKAIPKRSKAVICMLMLPVFMTGCCEKSSEPDFNGFVYDKWTYQPVSDEFSVVRDENNVACLSYANGDAGTPLIRDCFTDTSDFGLAMLTYIDGETVYYLNQYKNYHYEIIALNTNDFSEQSVHEAEWSDNIEEMDMLFGLGFYLPKKMQQDEQVDSFFVHDNQLILSKSSGIYWYDLDSDSEVCIYAGKANNLAFTCDSVYYIDEVLDVYRYDIQEKTTVKMPIGKSERFYAAEDGLYCKDLLDGKFYFVSPDGSQKEPSDEFDEEQFLKENLA